MATRTSLLVAAGFAAAAYAPSALAARGSLPALRLVRSVPATVQGIGFHPRERVRLVVKTASGTSLPELVRAGARGTFVASFPNLPLSRCSSLIVVATGARGSSATLRRPPLPACLPASTP